MSERIINVCFGISFRHFFVDKGPVDELSSEKKKDEQKKLFKI